MRENKADEINLKKDKPQIADDSQAEIDKAQPDNEYALDCQLCHNSMVLQHNIHTIVLLFQFYKCKCVYTDIHIIVRDKRSNQSVVHRSKGMQHDGVLTTRRILLRTIIQVSKRHWVISSLTDGAVVDALPDLIVDEHMIDEYKIKDDDVKDDFDRFGNSQLVLSHIFSLEEYDDIGDITTMKHVIRLCEALAETGAFLIWVNRLAIDT